MNKKIIIGISFLIILIVSVSFLIYQKRDNIPTYDADIICSFSTKESLDDDKYDSKSVVYIFKDNNIVNKTINQSIMSANSDTRLLESIISLYDNIDGIDAYVSKIDDSVVFEVIYDYDKIDLNLIKENLSSVLDETSILMNISELPINVDEYLDLLSDNYKCEVK